MTSSPSSSDASPTAADGHAPLAPRRSVLVHLVTAVLSFVIVTIPATLGGLFFLDPILRKRKDAEAGGKSGEVSRKDEKGFIRLNLTRDSIPADGTPVPVTVLDDIVDAWNRFKNVPAGSIWLRKLGIILILTAVPDRCGLLFSQAHREPFSRNSSHQKPGFPKRSRASLT